MKASTVRLGFISMLLISSVVPLSLAQEVPGGPDYRSLSVEVQLLIADIKLDEMLKSQEFTGDQARLEDLNQAQDLLWKGLMLYKHYETGEAKYLSENAKQNYVWGTPYPGFPDIGASPFGVLDHLGIALYDSEQTNAQIMVADRRYSEAERVQIESLKKAVELIKNSLNKAENALGLTLHISSTYQVMITVPSEYKFNSAARNPQPIDLLKTKPDGSPVSLVQVLVHQENDGLGPEEFREKRIQTQRQRFPDLKIVFKGENQGDAKYFKTSYAYTYTWKGDLIKTLITLQKYEYRVYEISCTAPADSFDAQNFEEIIKTFRH